MLRSRMTVAGSGSGCGGGGGWDICFFLKKNTNFSSFNLGRSEQR